MGRIVAADPVVAAAREAEQVGRSLARRTRSSQEGTARFLCAVHGGDDRPAGRHRRVRGRRAGCVRRPRQPGPAGQGGAGAGEPDACREAAGRVCRAAGPWHRRRAGPDGRVRALGRVQPYAPARLAQRPDRRGAERRGRRAVVHVRLGGIAAAADPAPAPVGRRPGRSAGWGRAVDDAAALRGHHDLARPARADLPVDHTGTHKITRPGTAAGPVRADDPEFDLHPASGLVIELDSVA